MSQHARWPWGEKLLRASLDTPLGSDSNKNISYIKHNNIINKSISCGTTIFRFNKEGIAEFDSFNYSDAVKLTQFQDCYILEGE